MNFLIKKFSPTILTISLLLLLFTFYKSEIFWHGNNRYYYKTYYLISLILIFFSIISFFFDDKIKQYLIISGISIVISLYLIEVYLTYKNQLSKEKPLNEQLLKEQLYEKQTNKKWDKRKKIEIYKDLKKTNNEIVISLYPRNFFENRYATYLSQKYSILPLGGISNSETINCNENGYYSIYLSDRYGFNNPDMEWDKEEIEYFLVGDSFLNGDCVNRPKDISSVLRKLSNKSVLNLGQGGNGSLIQYVTLREYLNKNVKKVLWIYYEGNDLYNLSAELRSEILLNYLKNPSATQNLKLKQNEIDMLGRKIIKEFSENEKKEINEKDTVTFLKLNEIREILKNQLPENQTSKKVTSKFTINEFIKILNLTKDLIKQNNSKLYFVYLPEYSHYKLNYDNSNYDLVKNIVTELNIPFVDIHKEVFEKEKNPLELFPFQMTGHYNAEGYKKVAEAIYKLTKN